ncbi:MAG TPA: SAM-dependent methyltransferase [Thermomicrobiaceae bacterium]|nr:SAM-dependent methyltransferase [Thermomicrobiaceae bacterium]
MVQLAAGDDAGGAGSPVIFSVSEAYFPVAAAELCAAFPGAEIARLGPDTGRLTAAGVDIGTVARVCQQGPIIFVQHLMRERASLPSGVAAEATAHVALDLLQRQDTGPELALHVWRDGASPSGERPDELWHALAEELRRHGFAVARGGRAHVLSVLLTAEQVIVGLNRRADALVDWPGGRVGLARSRDQLSRAEFKLEELFQVFDLALPEGGVALDLGASPGGWTRILRRRGFTVWAIDPGELDARIAADPGVHHVRDTAGPFLAGTDLVFDLVVDDMRMTPALSCRLMLEAARRLKPRGLAIVTLKISPRGALSTVRQSLAILSRAYEITHARQLFHNRNEVTVVARRRRRA